MRIEIRVHRKFSSRVNRALLRRLMRRAMSTEKQRKEVSVYITTDAEIRLFNRKFHATNAPTDVLSFPSRDLAYLGDIVISYDRARAQARVAGWRIANELSLLAIHGLLHLAGYDDSNPRERVAMWKRQEKILGKKELH
jgi:probable rRNA maturation factor